MAEIEEFAERARDLMDDVAAMPLGEYQPDFSGARVWVLSESRRADGDYHWVGICTSLEEAQSLGDRRMNDYQHGEPMPWQSWGQGMRGPSDYRRYIPGTNLFRQHQLIEQAFLNGGGK